MTVAEYTNPNRPTARSKKIRPLALLESSYCLNKLSTGRLLKLEKRLKKELFRHRCFQHGRSLGGVFCRFSTAASVGQCERACIEALILTSFSTTSKLPNHITPIAEKTAAVQQSFHKEIYLFFLAFHNSPDCT